MNFNLKYDRFQKNNCFSLEPIIIPLLAQYWGSLMTLR